MPLLQVRNVPQELYEELCRVAKIENRSIAQETIQLLSQALQLKQGNRQRRKYTLEQIAQLDVQRSSSFPDPAQLLREDRER